MRGRRRSARLLTTAAIALALALALAAAAIAAWSAQGDGTAAGAATTMPAGQAPTVQASGSSVTVSWPAATLAGGTPVAGYTIQRYDTRGVAAAVGATCNGTVTATTCTETNVPPGTWAYTDTPVQDSWTGAKSPASNAVTIG